MKEFDIDKLKRENIFKTPAGFFEDMQSKVLQEIKPVPRGKIIKLNWAYSAAAAIALLIGVIAFFNSESAVETEAIAQQIPQETPVMSAFAEVQPEKKESTDLKIAQEDLTSASQIYQNRKSQPKMNSAPGKASFAVQKEKAVKINPEIQVDQILSSFTSAELANLGRNTEQDIYLDLYN